MCFIFFEQMLQCKSSSPTSSINPPGMTGLGSSDLPPDGSDGDGSRDHGIFSPGHSYSCPGVEAPFQLSISGILTGRGGISSNFQVMTDAADGVETISRTSNWGSKGVSAANFDMIRSPGMYKGVGISAAIS
jgi:hypothetical protein